MLEDAGVDHGKRGEKEACEDATDGAEVDFELAKEWVDAHCQARY